MKKFVFILVVFAFSSIKAQVGINTTDPKAQLEIKSSDQTNPANNDGILIPKVDAFPAINPTVDQDGMMVYLTTVSGANQPGFYYWDNTNTLWKPIGGDGAKKIDDLTDGKSDNSSVFLGLDAGNSDDNSDNKNVGIGYQSLFSNTTGENNISFGYQSLYSNASGFSNIAIGLNSMRFNSIGNNNIAFGDNSLFSNTTGYYNIAHGPFSLELNTTGFENTAIGAFALQNNTANYNVAVGSNVLKFNTSGTYNTAIGAYSLNNNSTGSVNTAIGTSALRNNTIGYYNVANGAETLYFNTSGSGNIANGNQSLYSNTLGCYNIANGYQSLYSNTIGADNIAIGYQSLYSNTIGGGNIAVGIYSLYKNTTGLDNIALGINSLYKNTTGQDNIALGSNSLRDNTTGAHNVSIGGSSGSYVGNYCYNSTFIGFNTGVPSLSTGLSVTNATAIGNGALVFQNNMMRLGNSAVTRIETQVGLTVVSDGRYKYNVKEEVKGLDFIKKLRPVVYQYDTEKMDREWMNVEFDTMVKHNPQILKDYKKASQIRYSGFIAQEVEQVAKSIDYEFSGISKPENSDGHYGLDYSSFVVPLVKAVQEQQEIIEEQNQKIKSLENRLSAIEAMLKK